jgi:3-phosphoshikimate 1-carboxyvinyltransferase
MTGRALAAALLARGVSEIKSPSLCDDGLAAAGALEALGARIEPPPEKRRILAEAPAGGAPPGHVSYLVEGTGAEGLRAPDGGLDCGESGLAMRMFAPICALIPGRTVLRATGSLRARPMQMVEALTRLGAPCATEHGHAPSPWTAP